MTSLNNYYNFLKENNISNIDTLKEFLVQDTYKLKFKEDKENSNIILIYNDSESNLNEYLVRFFNGVIIDKNTLKVICYTFDKCIEETNIDTRLFNNDVKIQPVYEGTLIRLYYHDNKWNISTKKMINANNAKWSSEKSFGDMFLDIFPNYSTVFNNTNYCYSFLMGHVENNIIQKTSNYLIHLNTIDLVNNIEIFDEINYNQVNVNHINSFGSIMINMNEEAFKNHIHKIKNDTGLNEIGYMCITNDGNKQKFMKHNYNEIRELWGNTNNRLFRYLHLRKNPDKLKKYLEIFTCDKQKFLDYENYLMNIATFILNIYRNRHISKSITKVPFYIRDIIYKVHGLYLQTKNKVNFQDINVLLHDLDEKKFCYIINNIEKDKKKIEEQKNIEQNESMDTQQETEISSSV